MPLLRTFKLTKPYMHLTVHVTTDKQYEDLKQYLFDEGMDYEDDGPPSAQGDRDLYCTDCAMEVRDHKNGECPDAPSPEACPGCQKLPGDGLTEGCDHPEGCGFWRNAHKR